MAEVFGIDIERFLSLGLDERPVYSGDGSLFGALLRKVNPSSGLYQDGEFTLSLPLLDDDDENRPEIVKPSRRAEPTTQITPGKEYDGEYEDDVPAATFAVTDTLRGQALTRPYFQFASPEEFADAMYGPRDQRSFREHTLEQLVDHSLLALEGIGSDIYPGNLLELAEARRKSSSRAAPVFVHVSGQSVVAVANFVRRFTWLLTLRQLLDAAIDALGSSRDPAQLALAGGMRDLLYVHSASLSATRSAYAANCGSSSTLSPAEAPVTSVADLWQSTALHRSTLWHLFSLVAPPTLVSVVDGLRTEMRPSSGSSASRKIEVLRDFLSDNKQTRSRAWTRPATVGTDELDSDSDKLSAGRGSGWQLLDGIYKKVEQLRRVVWGYRREHIMFSGGGDGDFGLSLADYAPSALPPELSDAFAHLIVAACLLRRVSVPLLAHLQRCLFQLEPGSTDGWDQLFSSGATCVGSAQSDQAETEAMAQLSAMLPVPCSALWNPAGAETGARTHSLDVGSSASNELCGLLSAQAWARGRIAVLVAEGGRLTGTSNVLDSPSSSASAGASSQSQRLVELCRHLTPPTTLALPLHPRDFRAMEQCALEAERRLDGLSGEVRRVVSLWALDKLGVRSIGNDDDDVDDTNSEERNENRGRRAGAVTATSSTSLARERGALIALVADPEDSFSAAVTASLSAPTLSGTDSRAGAGTDAGADASADDAQEEERLGDSEDDGNETSVIVSSPFGLEREVDPVLLQAARAALIDKYEAMGKNLDIRSALTRWRSDRVIALAQSKGTLSRILQDEESRWRDELAVYEEFTAKQLAESGQTSIDKAITSVGGSAGGHGRVDKEDSGQGEQDGEMKKESSVGDAVAGASSSSGGDRSSVRVQQNPGGSSSLSLAADDSAAGPGAVTGGDRSSVRVQQNPGGSSSLSLAADDSAAGPGAVDRKSTHLNSSHLNESRMPSSA